jgi:hypothetical protein
MIATQSRRIVRGVMVACGSMVLASAAASAQNITGVVAAKNAGNSASEVSTANPSYERESFVQVTSATASSFVSRYFGWRVPTPACSARRGLRC